MDKQAKATLIKAVCALTTDSTTLAIAKWWEMTPNGRAAAHLDQYLEGKGDLRVDLTYLNRGLDVWMSTFIYSSVTPHWFRFWFFIRCNL